MRLSNTTMIHGICTRWYHTSTNSLTQVCAQRNLSRLILSLIAFPCLVCTYEIPLLVALDHQVTIDLRQKAGNSVINARSAIEIANLPRFRIELFDLSMVRVQNLC